MRIVYQYMRTGKNSDASNVFFRGIPIYLAGCCEYKCHQGVDIDKRGKEKLKRKRDEEKV